MNKRKSIISILIILAILTSGLTNTYAVEDDKLIMELKVGSSLGRASGSVSTIEKPYIINNTIMVPLAWVTSAIGAEVNWKENKTIEIIYQELYAQIKIGSTSYNANSSTKKLHAAPTIKNSKTMVPLEFISDNFPVTVTGDKKSGNIKIVLEDDGELKDLSFLTGGISSPAIGNSFYGWSLNVPSGSRIISNSFKSDVIGITNESRSLYIEINVENKNKRTLSDLYKDISYIDSVRESEMDLEAETPYFQYTRLSEYEESLRVKVFDKGEYFYYLTINCYDNTISPEKLMSDKYYNNIINSFNLKYKGNVKEVEDLSKVKQGEVSFYNYISLNSDTKYLPWSINIPVKWNQVLQNYDQLTTNLGLDSQHYMKITMNILDEEVLLDDYVSDIKNKYDKYFNPKVYSFISSDIVTIADTEAMNLKFSIKQADKVYIIDEFYFVKGSFVYEISVKLPESEYKKGIGKFIEAINKITFYNIDSEKYQNDMEKYESKNLQVRVSQQDEPFEYTNKTNNWSVEIPGYWTKSGSEYIATAFENPNTNANIKIDAVEKSAYTKDLTDEEKFSFLKLLETIYGAVPTKSITTHESGFEVRKYEYTIEDEELDLYLYVTSYCFESGIYSYNYTSIVPELTATEEAIKEIENIWDSFKLVQK